MKNPISVIYDTNCLPGMQNKRKSLSSKQSWLGSLLHKLQSIRFTLKKFTSAKYFYIQAQAKNHRP